MFVAGQTRDVIGHAVGAQLTEAVDCCPTFGTRGMPQKSGKVANRMIDGPFPIARNCACNPSLKKRSRAAFTERLRNAAAFFLKRARRFSQGVGLRLTKFGRLLFVSRDLEDLRPGPIPHAGQEARGQVTVLGYLLNQNLYRALRTGMAQSAERPLPELW